MLVPNSCRHFGKTKPRISRTISKSLVDGRDCLKFIPTEFLLEWFLKSLLPYIAKYVSTSGVQNEEQTIFNTQELDLIYAQSIIFYEIIPNAPRSNFDPKVKPRPHVHGIVGCTSTKLVDSVVKQVIQLSINQSASR